MQLFEEDKRLTLKPVRDFSELLRNAFVKGPCSCLRCQESNGNQEGYQHLHTLEIEEAIYNRRFAITSPSDVRRALAKAWEAFYKTDIPETGPVDMEAILEMVLDQIDLHERLPVLLYISGVIKDVDDSPVFVAVSTSAYDD